MKRFAPALRRAARELDLPSRARAPILLEMAADLEAVYAHHRDRGLEEEEAARRAEETVLGSPEILRRLTLLHRRRPPWREWSEETGERLGRGTDLLLLALGVGPVLGLAGASALPILLNAPWNPLVWAVLGSGAGVAGIVAWSVLRLSRGTSGPVLRRELSPLLLLSVLAPALGLLALGLGLHHIALSLSAEGVGTGAPLAVAERLARDASLSAVGLLVGIAGSLAWFVLMNRASLSDVREVDALLEGRRAGPRTGPARRPLSLLERRS